ncbi:Hypothetical lipoprotein [Zobellia galactanivorans]|uniref:Hypothetical lipoprotein n=1 Tax=Zobellia galactanivorans (strain DSM 12802 / CCUG 47099 / CIP 106680 / NCIMB 13871 / Dsij) TaxID=63186 RepID=G0L8F9_ZOBGA|nr:Hypothetical lipoprotein [Zobellia galactanivorans]
MIFTNNGRASFPAPLFGCCSRISGTPARAVQAGLEIVGNRPAGASVTLVSATDNESPSEEGARRTGGGIRFTSESRTSVSASVLPVTFTYYPKPHTREHGSNKILNPNTAL